MKLSDDIEFVRYALATRADADARLAFDRILAPRCVSPEIAECLDDLDIALGDDLQDEASKCADKLRVMLAALPAAPHSANVPTIDAALAAAQSEEESWETIVKWCKAGRGRHVRLAPHHCYVVLCDPDGDRELQQLHGTSRAHSIARAAEWCRAELAK